MTKRWDVMLGIVMGAGMYTPNAVYLLDNSLATMLDRAYFLICGGAVALYARS